MLLSKCLGLGIVAGATLGMCFIIIDFSVKLPQIIKILKTGSAKGLSIPAALLELICYTSTSSYSIYRKFPFRYTSKSNSYCISTFGDATFLQFQSAIICFLCISWEISYLSGVIFLSSYGCFLAYTLSSSVEFSLLVLMQTLNTPVVLFSRVSNICL